MGLEPFTVTEIRSSIMGISLFIFEEQIAWVIRRASEGRYVSGLDNNKTSPWNETVNKTMFHITKKGKYCDLSMEHKLLLKIQNENLLPKGGRGDQPSLDNRVFLHFFMTMEEIKVGQKEDFEFVDRVASVKQGIGVDFRLDEHGVLMFRDRVCAGCA